MAKGLVIAQTVAHGLLARADRRQSPGVRRTPPPDPLEHLERGTGAGPARSLQGWSRGEPLGDHGALGPRGVLAPQPHGGRRRHRSAPSAIAPVAGPPRLPAARPRESLLPGGLGPSPLHAAGGPVPSPPGEGPAEREQGVAIAVAHQRAMPWEPQRGPPGRHPRAARCIVTQQAEGPRGGCFFHPCRACWAVCGWTGSALRWRDVAREG